MSEGRELWHNHVWSWEAHSFAAIFAPALAMVAVRRFLLDAGFHAFAAYVAGVTLMALYYWHREKGDKAAYRAKGTLDKRQADLTGRTDGAGDALGPYAAACASLTGLTMFGAWWLPIIPVALGLAYIAYETGRAQENR